jgi:hypothetical protein
LLGTAKALISWSLSPAPAPCSWLPGALELPVGRGARSVPETLWAALAGVLHEFFMVERSALAVPLTHRAALQGAPRFSYSGLGWFT